MVVAVEQRWEVAEVVMMEVVMVKIEVVGGRGSDSSREGRDCKTVL
jgi:hypothetical protein